MRPFHFHTLRWDTPFAILKIDLVPGCITKLGSANEGQYKKADGELGLCAAIVLIERSHKLAEFFAAQMRVITPERDIAWNDLARLNDEEMKHLMHEIVDKMYTVFLNLENPDFADAFVQLGSQYTGKWDKPKELPDFILRNRKTASKTTSKKPARRKTTAS